jgi:MoxR-like ATPase
MTEKEREGVSGSNPADEGVNSSEEEKEQQELEERLHYAFETIAKEMPGTELDYAEYDRNSIYIWVPYVKDGADRGALVGVLYLVRENPETHAYYLKSEEELLDDIKSIKQDFVFVQSQICEAMKQFQEANKQ